MDNRRHRNLLRTFARRLIGLSIAGALFFAVHPAAAQQGPDEPDGGVAAELGYGNLAEDSFVELRLKLGYRFEVPQIACADEADDCDTLLRLAAQAPLRLRVADAAPIQDTILRESDWDETSDYLRVVRGIEYGRPTEPLYAKIGELGPISLGHGTLINDYYNVITVDHFQLGAAAAFDTVYGGAEAMLDNVVEPAVLGGRAYVRPWAFVDKDHLLSRLAIGASAVADIDAPTRLAEADGTPGIAVSDTNNPIVLAAQNTAFLGLDVEFSLVESELVGVVPYADFNHHTSLGSGLHAGAFVSLRPSDSIELLGHLEYRRVGQDYLPSYFGPIYEIDRYQFTGWGQEIPAPKVRVAASLDRQTADGAYGALTARLSDFMSVTAAYSDHEGPKNQTLRLRAAARPLDSVQVGAFYYKQNFEGLSNAFDLDGALVVGEGRVGVWGPLYAVGSYGRMWRLEQDGAYETVDDWSLGAGASVGF